MLNPGRQSTRHSCQKLLRHRAVCRYHIDTAGQIPAVPSLSPSPILTHLNCGSFWPLAYRRSHPGTSISVGKRAKGRYCAQLLPFLSI